MQGCPGCHGIGWGLRTLTKLGDAMLGCECNAGMPCPDRNDMAKDGIEEPDIREVLTPDPLLPSRQRYRQ